MKKKIIVLGTHDPTLGSRLADELAKFRLSDVVRADCEHSNIRNECEFPYGHRKICQDCGKDFTI